MKPRLAAFGSADLRFLEYAKSRGRDHAIAYIERKYPRALRCCRGIDLAQIPAGEPEVAMALDLQVPAVRHYVYPEPHTHAAPCSSVTLGRHLATVGARRLGGFVHAVMALEAHGHQVVRHVGVALL